MTHLRVGLVCPYSFSAPGGVQNHVLGLASQLRKQGHHAEILGPGDLAPGTLESYALPADAFTSTGYSVPIKFNGSVARISFGPSQWRAVKRWLDAGRFDVIHLHEPMPPSVAQIALWLTDAPVVATFHTSMPVMAWIKRLNRLVPQAVKRIDASIAVSTLARDVAREHFQVDPVIIGNGISIDDHELHRCDGRWRGGDHPVVTFLGRYNEPRKGFGVLLRALGAVRTVHPDLEVVVAGAGTPIPADKVTYRGFVSDAERNELLGNSDIYVAPNTGRESFGIVLLEGLASGAPVVASDIPAFRDVLTTHDGEVVGKLFRNEDSADLARAMLESLAEPRDAKLEPGRARAAEFDWSVLVPHIEQQYRRAIESRA